MFKRKCYKEGLTYIRSNSAMILQCVWFTLVISPVLNWFLRGRLSHSFKSLSSAYLFIRWSSRAAVFSATHLALMRVSCITREIRDYSETQHNLLFSFSCYCRFPILCNFLWSLQHTLYWEDSSINICILFLPLKKIELIFFIK
jgi:hypothetical protein